VIRRAMVLAAGRGRRLAPLTDRIPKPLVAVAGRPLIEHILGYLRAGGVEDVVVNLHHLGHLIVECLGDGSRLGLRIQYSWEDTILDTGGGIKRAEPLLGGEPFVVMNGDSLLEMPLGDLIAFHRSRRGMATIGVRPDPDAARYGPVELDADDRVRRISGLPPEVPAGTLRNFMFPGVHVLEPGIFDWMVPDQVFGIMRETYPRMIAADVPVYGFVTHARWINIDTPAALAAADDTLRHTPFRY
jgi:NDP-sugar pyrophosphorylase family protein